MYVSTIKWQHTALPESRAARHIVIRCPQSQSDNGQDLLGKSHPNYPRTQSLVGLDIVQHPNSEIWVQQSRYGGMPRNGILRNYKQAWELPDHGGPLDLNSHCRIVCRRKANGAGNLWECSVNSFWSSLHYRPAWIVINLRYGIIRNNYFIVVH